MHVPSSAPPYLQVWQAMNTAVASIRAAEKDAGQYPHIITVQARAAAAL